MSVQFGVWKFDGSAVALDEQARESLDPYGADGESIYRSQGIAILFCSFSATNGRITKQTLFASSSGALIAWDGRLDNREELVNTLAVRDSIPDSDVAIVAAAYDRWNTECFERLLGDWALSIWNPNDHCLTLAKDVIGTRHLYYSATVESVTWSSVLDPLVLGKELTLDREYIAGWLSSYPRPTLTPYAEVHSVPPCSFVRFRAGRREIQKYWEFDGSNDIRYREDSEYEAHFRVLFEQSIRRRLRASTPVLAELSGGMDSTAIVSMADKITSSFSEAPQVDTVSYYNDSEPNWDERSYFVRVEEKRGRTGLHIDAGVDPSEQIDNNWIPLWPGSQPNSKIASWMKQHGHRVLLSGIGGDEFLGGVPTPVPELEDLFVRGRFKEMTQRLMTWALIQRRPWLHLLRDTISGFLPRPCRFLPEYRRPPSWLRPEFVRHYRSALNGYEQRWTLFGFPPSFQENLSALERLRRQVATTELFAGYPYEKRYPYLDRDLLAFLFAIPREQLVRPGERRSLMRRALRGIVPEEILNRRRKAFATVTPLKTIAKLMDELDSSDLVTASLGIIVPNLFLVALNEARQGKAVPIVPLLRALALERWLQNLRVHGYFNGNVVRIVPSRREPLTNTVSSSSISPSRAVVSAV